MLRKHQLKIDAKMAKLAIHAYTERSKAFDEHFSILMSRVTSAVTEVVLVDPPGSKLWTSAHTILSRLVEFTDPVPGRRTLKEVQRASIIGNRILYVRTPESGRTGSAIPF